MAKRLKSFFVNSVFIFRKLQQKLVAKGGSGNKLGNTRQQKGNMNCSIKSIGQQNGNKFTTKWQQGNKTYI